MVVSTILIIVLILFNGIFAMTEVALIGIDDNKLIKDVESGVKSAKKIQKFIYNETKFLSTIQIGITFFGFINGIVASDSYSTPLINFVSSFVVNPNILNILKPVITVVIAIILLFFQVIFGELVPKRIAIKYPEKVAYTTINFIVFFSIIATPFVFVFTKSADLISLIFNITPDSHEKKMTEEEIKMIVDVSELKGVLDKQEGDMIKNVINLDQTTCKDIMTPRVSVVAFEKNQEYNEIIESINLNKYTRYPIYDNDIDNIIGWINVKDLLEKKNRSSIKSIIRKPLFAPESQVIRKVLAKMLKINTPFCIVIDEYGGTSGIITMEDLIEEVMGSIKDEYDTENDYYLDESNDIISLGLANLSDLEDEFNLGLPIDEYDSLNGFLLDNLESDDSEYLIYKNYKYQILEKDNIIKKVRIIKLESDKEVNDDN
jgi:putative hemolysin